MPFLEIDYLKTIRPLIAKLENGVFTDLFPLQAQCTVAREPIPYEDRRKGPVKNISVGEKWGDLFDCAWFHITGKLPEGRYRHPVVLVDISGEGLVIDRNGNPVRGLTCKNSNYPEENGVPVKRVIPIEEALDGEGNIDITIDASANDLLGIMRSEAILNTCHIAEYRKDIEQLAYDFLVLADLLSCLDSNSSRYRKILFTLYDTAVSLDTFSEEKIKEARECLAGLYTASGEDSLRFTAIGHSHVDLAWLWPIRETKRKGGRTFANALKNMEKYPEYVFGASQPQLYQWVKENYPSLYEKVKERVKEGRWELQGCMWVESDTNLPSGESLVRQILYGKEFYRQEFGVEVKTLWLPDVFGYSGSLPQILKKSGCDYFLTQKLSWNQYNKMPHQTFTWQGIDGSRIFAHMLPEETYNSSLLPHQIRYAEYNYQDAGIANDAVILFGIGDGGGGPGENHLETARRTRNLSGICPVRQGAIQPVLERMEKETRGKRKTWCGELYLEKHQGTYTTQAKNKLYNRKAELALRELEFALSITDTNEEERRKTEEIWKEILLYQFHDILPGSSIKRVYDESVARYEILLSEIRNLTEKHYAKRLQGDGLAAFNPLSFPRKEILEKNGEYYSVTLPPLGCSSEIIPYKDGNAIFGNSYLENSRLKATFDSNGYLISLVQKETGREYITAPSGCLILYTDVNGDCWDISRSYLDRPVQIMQPVSLVFDGDGVVSYCKQRFVFGNSSAELLILLKSDADILEYHLTADWHEREKMLRTSFVSGIFTDCAAFETQFGFVKRSVYDNTSWNEAQYEECGHKYVDLSEPDHGIALLNDCKYGFRVKGQTMDMNILRSQTYPGTNADEGTHFVNYALYPHEGGLKQAGVAEKAITFNMPPMLCGGTVSSDSFATAEGVLIDTVKPAEDGNGIIIRAYEPYGCTSKAVISLNGETSVTETNLLENAVGNTFKASEIVTEFKPFEIKTYRLEQKHEN